MKAYGESVMKTGGNRGENNVMAKFLDNVCWKIWRNESNVAYHRPAKSGESERRNRRKARMAALMWRING